MSETSEPEVWLPDPIERCQDGLRHSWLANPEGECWYLSRSALERFFQEDAAGNDLPEEWRKLLAISNLPAHILPDLPAWQRFTAEDFAELREWSRVLGERLDLSPVSAPVQAEEITPIEPAKATTPRNNYAFIAAIVLLPTIGMYAYANHMLSAASDERRAAERRADVAEAKVKTQEAARLDERRARIATLERVNALSERNALLLRELAKISTKTPPNPVLDDHGIELAPLRQARNAGASTGWDVRIPAFTAMRSAPKELIWPKMSTTSATARIFDQTTGKSVWSHPTDLAAGRAAGLPRLSPGHYYSWSVLGETEDLGYSSVPFYILSPSERRRFERALQAARSDAERAAVTAKFGLFDELGAFGIQAKRRLALD